MGKDKLELDDGGREKNRWSLETMLRHPVHYGNLLFQARQTINVRCMSCSD
ncbi:hypothetical protein KIN20_014393 [Parelaphostrongylus tenuis]|uniref:Uncharacterized protein n=1 Tax=Parelaphostrongylus tenuis TaxID=148309 RepID=A0AAD5MDL4_PARTN|nr:hypothetical protein KIN20_014393 [Parelaphostrongylus tenuis]